MKIVKRIGNVIAVLLFGFSFGLMCYMMWSEAFLAIAASCGIGIMCED